jgi:hypothetical protein
MNIWMKKSSSWLIAVAALIVLSLIGSTMHYFLPRHVVVQITGVEVKRMDKDGVINADNPADGPTRDVHFIYTERPGDRKIMVFENEDTGWGFPWYFKFDSADVQARAQGISRTSGNLALVRYYGWRIHLLSWFPNAISVRETATTDEPLPLFNITFFAILLAAILYPVYRVRRWLSERRGPQVVHNDDLGGDS